MRLLRWKSHNIKLIILNWAIQCHLVLLQCCIQPPPLSSSETVLLLHSKTSHQSAVPPHFSLPLQPSVCIFVLMGLPILDVYIESYNMWPFTFGFFACMCAQHIQWPYPQLCSHLSYPPHVFCSGLNLSSFSLNSFLSPSPFPLCLPPSTLASSSGHVDTG